jgi:carnitine 3-dehydrogenase
LFIRILKGGAEVATVEQMLLHVDMARGKACAAPEGILARVAALAQAHSGLPMPEGAGRGIGMKP